MGDAPGLCERVRAALQRTGAPVLVCDARELQPDVVTVEALARMQLTARRLGRRIELRGVTPQLGALLSFVGLADVLLGRGPLRQAEEREQPCRVEERVDRGDAAV